jgi:hypothetical protein
MSMPQTTDQRLAKQHTPAQAELGTCKDELTGNRDAHQEIREV